MCGAKLPLYCVSRLTGCQTSCYGMKLDFVGMNFNRKTLNN